MDNHSGNRTVALVRDPRERMSESATTSTALAAAASATGPGATARAARTAVAGLEGNAGLVLGFCSQLDPVAAARGLQEAAPRAHAAGMTGSGVIGCDGALEQGCSVVAFGAATPVGVGVSSGARKDLAGAAHAAVTDAALGARAAGARAMTMILCLDTRSGDQSLAISGAYAAAGPRVPLVGGGAGGDDPAQFAGGEAHEDSVVAIAIGGEEPGGVGIAHGCRSRGAPAIATRSEGRRLLELDGRPATEVYLERLGYGGMRLGKEEFEALAVTHPLAQPELGRESRLRHVLGRGPHGGLDCATHIPVNSGIEFTHQSPDDIIESSARAVRSALRRLSRPVPRAALIFDCAGRKRAVAGALRDEVAGLSEALGPNPPPYAGLFSHGEVFRLRGAKGDRNHAVVVAAFA